MIEVSVDFFIINYLTMIGCVFIGYGLCKRKYRKSIKDFEKGDSDA
jgi:hypothetical protein